MEKRVQEMEAKIKGILSAAQFKRYQELSLQLQGPTALMRREVSEQVGLNDSQRQQIETIMRDNRPPMPPQGGQGGNPPDFEAMRKQMDKMREEVGKKILAVLTPSQKDKWDSMLGKPFKFETGPGFGPGRGPGGGE
jgi:Spy/CpxP family protein refolding chaperone